MLTPYYVHVIQGHQKKKQKTPASMHLRSRPTMYTPYKTTRRRKEPSLKVPTLTLYYVHAIQAPRVWGCLPERFSNTLMNMASRRNSSI